MRCPRGLEKGHIGPQRAPLDRPQSLRRGNPRPLDGDESHCMNPHLRGGHSGTPRNYFKMEQYGNTSTFNIDSVIVRNIRTGSLYYTKSCQILEKPIEVIDEIFEKCVVPFLYFHCLILNRFRCFDERVCGAGLIMWSPGCLETPEGLPRRFVYCIVWERFDPRPLISE